MLTSCPPRSEAVAPLTHLYPPTSWLASTSISLASFSPAKACLPNMIILSPSPVDWKGPEDRHTNKSAATQSRSPKELSQIQVPISRSCRLASPEHRQQPPPLTTPPKPKPAPTLTPSLLPTSKPNPSHQARRSSNSPNSRQNAQQTMSSQNSRNK